jgi:predicted hydrocarbon binding protein
MHIFLIIDLTNTTIAPEKIKRDIATINGIYAISIIEPYVNLVIDTLHFPLTLHEKRVFIVEPSFMKGLIEGLSSRFGEGVAYVILWHIGYKTGEGLWDLFPHEKKIAERELVELMLKTRISVGWLSHYEIIDYSSIRKYARIRVWNNWECQLKGNTGKVESHFLRGVLAGFFTKHFNADCQAYETKCISKGDEYCEYEIKPK